MDYQRLYNSIVFNRLNHPLPLHEYGENHHIIPKCIGGDNTTNNMVRLSPREHFLCHYILTKMWPVESSEYWKLHHAFMMMAAKSRNQHRYFNSRLYEATAHIRRHVMSIAQSGTLNSQHGSRWITNGVDTRRIAKKDIIPSGWSLGRIIKSAAMTHYVTNGVDTKRIPIVDTIPDGWVAGRCLKSNNKGNTRITNGVKSKFLRSGLSIPDGWTVGSPIGMRSSAPWITNGIISRRVFDGESIPDGWVRGFTKRWRKST